jgi:hypothetical protein
MPDYATRSIQAITKTQGLHCVFKVSYNKYNIPTNYFLQRMHYLLKHKILQFVFKCFT